MSGQTLSDAAMPGQDALAQHRHEQSAHLNFKSSVPVLGAAPRAAGPFPGSVSASPQKHPRSAVSPTTRKDNSEREHPNPLSFIRHPPIRRAAENKLKLERDLTGEAETPEPGGAAEPSDSRQLLGPGPPRPHLARRPGGAAPPSERGLGRRRGPLPPPPHLVDARCAGGRSRHIPRRAGGRRAARARRAAPQRALSAAITGPQLTRSGGGGAAPENLARTGPPPTFPAWRRPAGATRRPPPSWVRRGCPALPQPRQSLVLQYFPRSFSFSPSEFYRLDLPGQSALRFICRALGVGARPGLGNAN